MLRLENDAQIQTDFEEGELKCDAFIKRGAPRGEGEGALFNSMNPIIQTHKSGGEPHIWHDRDKINKIDQ